MDVGEVQLGGARGVAEQPDLAAGESFTDVIVVALVPDMAGSGDGPDLVSLGVARCFDVFAEATTAAMVDLRRLLHLEGFVRAHVIAEVLPTLEAALLRGEGGGRWLGALGLQVLVHALVGAVVLRMTGPGKLHRDALVDPPHA